MNRQTDHADRLPGKLVVFNLDLTLTFFQFQIRWNDISDPIIIPRNEYVFRFGKLSSRLDADLLF